MPDNSKIPIPLGPKAIARLAVYADAVDALASTLEVEVRDDNAKKYAREAAFTPSAKLRRLAERGAARVVLERNSVLARVTPEVAAKRLVALGVDAATAAEVTQPLVRRQVLTSVELSDRQTQEAILALLVGQALTVE